MWGARAWGAFPPPASMTTMTMATMMTKTAKATVTATTTTTYVAVIATTGAADNNQLKLVAKEIVAAEAAVADLAMPAAIMLKVATVTALRRRRQRLCGSDGDPRQ